MRTRYLSVFLIGLLPCCAAQATAPLAWMAGTWAKSKDGKVHEEQWRATPAGLSGQGCQMRGDTVAFTEVMDITMAKKGPVFTARPRGQPSTAFPATVVDGQRVVFSNPAHDWPKEVEYWRTGDVLHARASGGDRVSEWTWQLIESAQTKCIGRSGRVRP